MSHTSVLHRSTFFLCDEMYGAKKCKRRESFSCKLMHQDALAVHKIQRIAKQVLKYPACGSKGHILGVHRRSLWSCHQAIGDMHWRCDSRALASHKVQCHQQSKTVESQNQQLKTAVLQTVCFPQSYHHLSYQSPFAIAKLTCFRAFIAPSRNSSHLASGPAPGTRK